ncbi:hypothetical protein [Brevibacillus laterosporus]|uniref:hypothetical protein n=1 Tax=Brevibacillus laterosporus TaxID=1465 RepID=UPI003D226C66
MKNQVITTNLLMKMFGINFEEVTSKTAEQATREKNTAYLHASSEIERALMFGSEAAQNENYKRGIVTWMQDVVEAGKFINSIEELPLAAKKTTMNFFNKIFPDFDKNASIAFGIQFNSAFKYLIAQPGAVSRGGEAYHLSRMILSNLDKRSNNAFFRKIRRNATLHDIFKERLDEYCVMWWNIAMQQAGTFDNGVVNAVKAQEKPEPSTALRAI